MPRLFTNNAATTLASDITNSATSLTVASGKGALFPSPSSPDYFLATLDDGTNVEIVKVTARSADTFTIVRGFDGTSGTAFAAATPTKVELRVPKSYLNIAHQADFQNNEWTAFTSDATANPATNPNAFPYIKSVANRPLITMKPTDAWSNIMQPALFGTSHLIILPNTSTTVGVWGSSVTSVGTVSHTTPTTSTGIICNFASTTTANSTAGTGGAVTSVFRGSDAKTPCGFFFAARIWLPDASYGSGATGTRIFVGVCSGTMASTVGSDDPGGHHAGFSYSTNAGNTAWQFSTKDNTTRNSNTTSLTFTAQHMYDFFIYCPPTGSTIYWRCEDLTNADPPTTQTGNTTSNLPGSTTLLRAGFQLSTLTTTARNIATKKVYLETLR